jgi:hypothetical protein
MDEPPLRAEDAPDELPHAAASDSLLSIEASAPAPKGVASQSLGAKIALAALGVLLLFSITAALWAASHFSPKTNMERPAADVTQR